MKEIALSTAKKLCDTMIRRYPNPKDLPLVGKFFYHQGVFLSGMMHIYELCGEEKYYDYTKAWVDCFVNDDGSVDGISGAWLDYLQPGILLYPIIRRTGEEKYKKALDHIVGIIRNWKVNKGGGFWHSYEHPNQMWLDSLYMGSPILAEYASEYGDSELYDLVSLQATLMYDNMIDKESGLMYHGWDESRKASWADPVTGLSPEIWGRAQGWYVVAMLDILKFLPENHPKRARLIEIERQLLSSLVKFRDKESGLWYQIVNKGDDPRNWIETSCSSLFIKAIAGAVRMGIVDESYKDIANEGFRSLCGRMGKDGDDIVIQNVCIGTCICNYEEYLARPTCENDLHGVGAFLLMCSEIAKIN